MGMFCYQCQETARGTGCEYGGVCGKSEELAQLMDLMIYTMKGISEIVVKGELFSDTLLLLNREMTKGLFMTITNANFDEKMFQEEIHKMIGMRDELAATVSLSGLHDAATFRVQSKEEMMLKAEEVGIFATRDPDIRSLRQLITYGLKGMAAYTHHARNLGFEQDDIYRFIHEALAATLDDSLSLDQMVSLTLKTGTFGVTAMALLDKANTSRYGNPEISEVHLGARKNPAILISGHDLSDLEQLLEQTKETGVDVYTHCEMLPAHYYPAFKKYDHLVGNYGNAWWKQLTEFESFNGPILFTTNCIVPPVSEEVKARIFTSGAAGYPGCIKIDEDETGKKDFARIIDLAKTLSSPDEIETGSLVGGFAHEQVFALADQITEAVRSGAIRKFVVMAGCDARSKASEYFSVSGPRSDEPGSRDYYTEFAEQLPKDTVILTAGCAKYRYNKLNLGDIGGIPRVLDAGQCNDSYSLALIALKLQEIFGLSDVNELPIVYNISWYEQKAVIVLLSLLSLGVKNIHLGPTLPAFLSSNVTKLLVENFGIAGNGTVQEDIKLFMGE